MLDGGFKTKLDRRLLYKKGAWQLPDTSVNDAQCLAHRNVMIKRMYTNLNFGFYFHNISF